MDGQSLEHSDSDSGESWTLLENNSVYADEPPEFIDDQEKPGAQQHEKDEDTDGISIISDSDHEAPTPPPGAAVYEKYQSQKENHMPEDISDSVSVNPDVPKIKDDHEPLKDEDFLEDSHVRHKTYVHKRNKRLSTVLNIIVLGSVITAAGVAIGHMWGAKNDCTMQSTSSVNKILSNLYKLQEENAYLRSKLKELTFGNNQHTQQRKQAFKHNKCRKVFEESLSNNNPKRFTKCVDENANNFDSLTEHFTKPKFEKEFIADIDKLKSVYLQNKSWLDDEISRRIKIEEELLKKYNDEVNSSNEQRKAIFHKNSKPILSDTKLNKDKKSNIDLGNFEHKISYADSLKTDFKPRFRRNEERYETDEDNEWLTSKQHGTYEQDILEESVSSDQSKPDQKVEPEVNYDSDYVSELTQNINNNKEQSITADNWAEEKPKTRRNEERYEDDNWSKYAKEAKNKRKNEKRGSKLNNNKQTAKAKGDFSNEERTTDYTITNSEDDIRKDDRYVINKLNKEKNKNKNTNSNKKEKRKGKLEKLNMKGEFGEKFEAESNPDDIALNYPNKLDNFDQVPFINKVDESENPAEKESMKDDKSGKKYENNEPANWFEKRAVFRTEARKKYFEQYGETSLNNSSWYFRRMRKREQCRAKGDNSTFKKNRKDKNYYKMKQ